MTTVNHDMTTAPCSQDGFTCSGNANWIHDASLGRLDDDCWRSGNIGGSENSTLDYDATFESTSNNVSFYYATDCEFTFDQLEYREDGNLIFTDSGADLEYYGALEYTEYSNSLSGASHNLEWKYTKDGFDSVGEDAVFIDDVVTKIEDESSSSQSTEVQSSGSSSSSSLSTASSLSTEVQSSQSSLSSSSQSTEIRSSFSSESSSSQTSRSSSSSSQSSSSDSPSSKSSASSSSRSSSSDSSSTSESTSSTATSLSTSSQSPASDSSASTSSASSESQSPVSASSLSSESDSSQTGTSASSESDSTDSASSVSSVSASTQSVSSVSSSSASTETSTSESTASRSSASSSSASSDSQDGIDDQEPAADECAVKRFNNDILAIENVYTVVQEVLDNALRSENMAHAAGFESISAWNDVDNPHIFHGSIPQRLMSVGNMPLVMVSCIASDWPLEAVAPKGGRVTTQWEITLLWPAHVQCIDEPTKGPDIQSLSFMAALFRQVRATTDTYTAQGTDTTSVPEFVGDHYQTSATMEFIHTYDRYSYTIQSLSIFSDNPINPLNSKLEAIQVVWDGNGSSIVSGDSSAQTMASYFSGRIMGWKILSDDSGSITVDVQKSNGSIPNDANSIVGSNKPTLSGGVFSKSADPETLKNQWSDVNIRPNDILRFEINSVSGITSEVKLLLVVRKL